MLIERNIPLGNADIIGRAYAIAANYLHCSGRIVTRHLTDEKLLKIVIRLCRTGDRNAIRIGNRAIIEYEQAAHVHVASTAS